MLQLPWSLFRCQHCTKVFRLLWVSLLQGICCDAQVIWSLEVSMRKQGSLFQLWHLQQRDHFLLYLKWRIFLVLRLSRHFYKYGAGAALEELVWRIAGWGSFVIFVVIIIITIVIITAVLHYEIRQLPGTKCELLLLVLLKAAEPCQIYTTERSSDLFVFTQVRNLQALSLSQFVWDKSGSHVVGFTKMVLPHLIKLFWV